MWALDAVETDGAVELWSGSADSLMVRWRDATLEQQQETVAARELQLQQEQELAIAMHAQQFDEAFQLALRLGHPRSLRNVVERLLPLPDGEAMLRTALAAIADKDVGACLQYARDWNTTAQHSLTAQRLVYNLLKAKPVATLLGAPQIQSTLEALLPYTERHFDRLDRLVQGTHLLGFTLQQMQGLATAPTDAPESAPADATPGDAEAADAVQGLERAAPKRQRV